MPGEVGVTFLSLRRAYVEALVAACRRAGLRAQAQVGCSEADIPVEDIVVVDLDGPLDEVEPIVAALADGPNRVIGLGGDAALAEAFGLSSWVTTLGPIEGLLTALSGEDRWIGRIRSANSDHGAADELTPREREVLGQLLLGGDTLTMAERLAISPKTLATHIQRVLAKLGVNSRAQAAAWALQDGHIAGLTTDRAAS